jgi:ParB family chromosome partitioning protein
MDQIQYLPHTALARHPQNMRRTYPPDQVRQMAASIRECGILQPLIAVPISDNGAAQDEEMEAQPTHHVVAGNLRLMAVRSLGADAPPVPVIIRDDLDADQQLLDMAIENAVRFDPDPISEGHHYRRILENPGMNVHKLHQQLGLSAPRIQNRLLWCQTEPEIQQLLLQKKIPLASVEQFLRLPAGQVRIETARRVARAGSSIRTITGIVTSVLNQLNKKSSTAAAHRSKDGPAVGLATFSLEAIRERRKHTPLSRGVLRAAAARACDDCPNHDSLGVPEPCWTVLSHGARETCQSCGLAAFRDVCTQCPLVICLREVYKSLGADT